MADRGQAELIGFALVFSILIVSLMLITTTGFAGLHGAQEHQRTANVQPAFEVFDANVNEVRTRGAPSRATEFKLAEGSLQTVETMQIHIEGQNVSRTVAIRALAYDSGTDTRLVYESGMLLRQDGDNAIARSTPAFHVDDEVTIFRFLDLQPREPRVVGGTATALVWTAHADTEVIELPPGTTITIEVETDHPEVWHAYLNSTTDETTSCSLVEETTIECQANRAYVVIDTVTISFL